MYSSRAICKHCQKKITINDAETGNHVIIDSRDWHADCAFEFVENVQRALGMVDLSSPKLITNWAPNPRGFMRAEFKDLYGEVCSIQKSSLATEHAIWLGLDQTGYRMHLNQEMAGELWQVLKRFAETGELTR